MNELLESPPESPSLTRRRRTFLAPLWLLAMAAVFMLAMAFAYWNSATTTTIVVMRHAKKQLGAITDAPLSPQGEVRATRLGMMFGDSEAFGRIRKIYASDARDLARRALRENRGGRALIIGHSNTVPEIVAALARVGEVPPIADEEFDTIYVVTVPTIGKASVLRMKY